MEVTTAIILETRFPRKDKLYPVKLRVTYNRKQKYYSIINPQDKRKIALSQDGFDKVMGEKPRSDYKDLRIILNAIEQNALDVIKALNIFSFEAFDLRFLKPSAAENNAFSLFEDYIKELKSEERISTMYSYQFALNSLKKFKKQLQFEDITLDLLVQYEKWMLKEGNSLTTIGFYLRALRAILNLATQKGFYNPINYPFGKGKYQIPTGRSIKKALDKEDIEKIYKYKAKLKEWEDRAKDFWFLSYLCNGINMKDIAYLKEANIDGDFLRFMRAKTKRSSRANPLTISVFLTKEAKEIIKKWRNPPGKEGDYLFPIINMNDSAEEATAKIRQFIKMVNKYIRQIAATVNVKKDLTTYTARHSFATTLKRSGVSREYISEALGHHSISTTESYLDSFEDGVKAEYANTLLDFSKKQAV